MKPIVMCIALIAFLAVFAVPAFAEDAADSYISRSGIYESANALESETKQILRDIGLENITVEKVLGFEYADVLKVFISALKSGFSQHIKAILLMVGTVILAAFVEAPGELGDKTKSVKIFGVIATLALMLSIAVPLIQTITKAALAVKSAAAFTISAIPVMCVICAAQGKGISAALSSGGAVGIAQVLSALFAEVFVPLCHILLALGLSAAADVSFHFERIIRLVRKYVIIAISAGASLYFTVLSLRTSISSAVDESTVKTIKFASSNFVPVIGSAISDSAVAVAASLAVSKNAIGVFGIICVAAIFLPLIAELLIWMLALEVSALIADIFSVEPLKNGLKSVADALSLVLVIVLFGAVLCIIHFGVLLSLRGAS
ncbi:MAG: hypothetical protein IJG23_03315 [Clostridia bacterium]|nr:hypothetical protein [Clostridia bacterium]